MERRGIKSINDRMNILDPWGNRIEIVPYDDCQFTKAPQVLKGMGASPIAKTANAIEELKKKGMDDGIVRTSKEFFRASFKRMRCALRSTILHCRLKFSQTISQSLPSVVIPLERITSMTPGFIRLRFYSTALRTFSAK